MATVVDCGAHSFKAGHCMESRPGIVRECANFQDSLCDQRFWHSLIGQRSQDLIVSLPLWTCRKTKERICELLFEHFAAKSVCMASSAFLAGLATGSSTALIVDIGASGTTVTPVEEGYPLNECAVHNGVGGDALDAAMSQLLQDAGAALPDGLTWREAGKAAKEALAWVAQDFTAELQNLNQMNAPKREPKPQKCDLVGAGGKRCVFQASHGEGFKCAETFFDAGRIGNGGSSDSPAQTLPELVLASLRLQSNINVRGRLLQNVVLVGGTSQLPGLQERLAMEIRCPCLQMLQPPLRLLGLRSGFTSLRGAVAVG